MSTLPINGKISVNAYVVYVYNVISALYCALNNHFLLFEYPLLQPLGWHVVECATHHETGVHEDIHPHICGVNKRRMKPIHM